MTVSAESFHERELLGRALAVLRERANLSQTAAGERFGVSGQNFGKYERGQAPSIEQRSVQERLAIAVGATREELLEERDRLAGTRSNVSTLADRMPSRMAPIPMRHSALLTVRDRVQAGAWLMADDTSQVVGSGHPIGYDPRYPSAQQWLSDVSGDSVDQLGIFDGDLVHCVDAIDIRYHPRTGDLVEVERTRFQGSERELTLKQIELTPQGVLLWPRSSNPRWQQPLDLTDGVTGPVEDIEIRIRGLVVASVRRF
ncbi:MAG: helix-turn-helix domain-containing protein [Phenylobacterium sp.]|nr:helix-turn-helix domain-containing protein [Phenylobacterium sp.]